MVFFLMKIIDAMVDDGLCLIMPGESYVAAILMVAMAAGLILYSDFCASFFAALVLECWANGKVDCIEFQFAGVIWLVLYGIRFFSETFTHKLVDMLAMFILGYIEECLHDVFDYDTVNSTIPNKLIGYIAEHRLVMIITQIPLAFLRGYCTGSILLLLAHDYGYESGRIASTHILKWKFNQQSAQSKCN